MSDFVLKSFNILNAYVKNITTEDRFSLQAFSNRVETVDSFA